MGGVARCEHVFELAAPGLEGLAAQIAIAFAEQIEEHYGGRDLLREKLHAGRSRMQAKLE